MASYDQIAKNNWRYRISLGKNAETGKYEYISKTGFKRKSDARNEAEMIERQLRDGSYIAPSTMTFEAVAQEWIKHYALGVKVSSVRARERGLNVVVNLIGHRPIQAITRYEYQQVVNEISEKYSKNYIDSILTTCNLVFKYALNMNLIQKLPNEGISRKKKPKTVEEIENNDIFEKFLEKEELEQFLYTAKHNHKPQGSFELFSTMAYSGCRVGEMLALKWSDVDFEENTIRITKTYYNPNNNKRKYQILTPKTQSSIRTITLDPIIMEMLKDYKVNVQDKWKDELYKDNNFVFTDNNGYPLSFKRIALWIQAIMSQLDIKKNITSHSFRHTHCALLIEAGVHIKEIQEHLGHADINTTMNIYAKITKSYKKDASTKFSNFMESTSNKLFE